MDVEIPPRSTRGLVDSLDDRGLVSGAARQGDQIIQWVLGRLLTLTCAEANLGAARRKTAGRRGRRLTSCSLGRISNWPNPGALGAMARVVVATAAVMSPQAIGARPCGHRRPRMLVNALM